MPSDKIIELWSVTDAHIDRGRHFYTAIDVLYVSVYSVSRSAIHMVLFINRVFVHVETSKQRHFVESGAD